MTDKLDIVFSRRIRAIATATKKRKYFPRNATWDHDPRWIIGDGPYRLRDVPWEKVADGTCL